MHPCLGIARLHVSDLYHFISGQVWICEALYSAIIFPAQRSRARRVEEKSCKGKNSIPLDFDATCAELETHLARWAAATDWQKSDLVGFSLCFNQLLATLAAVSYLKKEHPRLCIVLGGSSCHADFAPALRLGWGSCRNVPWSSGSGI